MVIDSAATDTTQTLSGLVNKLTHFWRARAHNPAGWGPFSEVRTFFVAFASPLPAPITLSSASGEGIPSDFESGQNYPNPFNATSTIRYGVPERSAVSIVLFNLLGQQIAVLENNEKPAGYHSAFIDGTALGSGTYFYRLILKPLENAGDAVVLTKKMTLLK